MIGRVELNRTELKCENWSEYNVIKYEYYVPRKLGCHSTRGVYVFNGPKIYKSSQGGDWALLSSRKKRKRDEESRQRKRPVTGRGPDSAPPPRSSFTYLCPEAA